jgi:hypothetical protein
MNPISRLLVTLVSIVGFFVVPALLLSWLLVFKLENPAFYIKAVDYSNVVVNFIEDNVRNSTSIPGALKKNVALAKDSVDEQIKDHIQPQIQSMLRQTLNWLRGRSRVPVYAVELTLFKKDTAEALREALKQQKFTDRLFVSSCLAYLEGAPNVVYLDKPLKKESLVALVKPWKTQIAQAFQWKKFAPLVPFVFLLLFMVFTLNFRYSFHGFSSMLTISGGFFFILFGAVLVAVAAAFPFVSSHLIRFLRPYNPGLPDLSFIQLVKFLLLTVSLQGLIASAAMIGVGVLFYTKKRVKKKKGPEAEVVPAVKA